MSSFLPSRSADEIRPPDPRASAATTVESVAAVIVTYNRKELLARCLDAVLGQTQPVGRIIVIDNCSTDGTPEFLDALGYLARPNLEYVRLAENAGGAGGFHEGMKRGFEQGFEWLWMMDDDGLPQTDTLAKLLECPSHILFRGCLVTTDKDPAGDELAFGIVTGSRVFWSVTELQLRNGGARIVEGYANPFNGLLVSREVVRRIGLPKKELFIWGDETEYFLRAKRADVPIATVLGARFSHPPDRARRKPVRFGFMTLRMRLPPEDPFRCYVMVRNAAYLDRCYYGLSSWTFLRLLAYPFLFPRRAVLLTRALWDGTMGRLLPPERARAVASRLCR